jgi:hypothetical protein
MSTSYPATGAPPQPSAPNGRGPAFGGPIGGVIGTGGSDDELFRAIVRSLVGAAPAVRPFYEFVQITSVDSMPPIQARAKKFRSTAFGTLGVLLFGLLGGIGAWSLGARSRNIQPTTYRFVSLPNGAYLLEANRVAGGKVVAAQTKQLWMNPEGRFVVVTITPGVVQSREVLASWPMKANTQLSLLGRNAQPAYVGQPPFVPAAEAQTSKPILAEWEVDGFRVDIEQGFTVSDSPQSYFDPRGEAEETTEKRRFVAERLLEAQGNFKRLLESLEPTDRSNLMAGMKIPDGFTLVDEVVNRVTSYRTPERFELVVKLKGEVIVRTSVYDGVRRTLTLPVSAMEPDVRSFPAPSTGVSLPRGEQRIDMEIPALVPNAIPALVKEAAFRELESRLKKTTPQGWRAWADKAISDDLDVFERAVWKSIPISLAWRKSATTSSEVTVCFGLPSSTSCARLASESPTPFTKTHSILLSDGRWVLLQRDVEGNFRSPETAKAFRVTGERLPFTELWVHALVVPKDQDHYVVQNGFRVEPLGRPLR